MTDPLDRLRQPVEPLAPPRGTFDAVLATARRRRTVRTSVLAALASLAVVGTGGLVLASGNTLSGGRLEGPPAGGRSPVPSVSSSPTASPPRATPTSRAAPALPHGPVPRGFLPYSVTSVGGGVTYLLGDAPCRQAPCTSVVRTTNGGETWVGVPAPKAELPSWQTGASPRSTVRDIRFASVRDGWAYGGALFATHDAARSWRPVDPGGTVLDLATDGTTTFAVVAACDAQGLSCRSARLRSAPAGVDRWTDVPGVTGGNFGRLSLGSGAGAVLLTESSGVSHLFVRSPSRWVPSPPPCPQQVSGVTAGASSRRLFAFCGGGAAGTLGLQTWVSDDSGRSWQRSPRSVLRLANGTFLNTAGATSTVVLATMLSPDFPNTVARSGNAGQTWADSTLPSVQGGWRYVGARTATDMVALPGKPDGSLWSSSDSGASWTAYRFR